MNKLKILPKGFLPQLMYIVLLPAFFIAFALVYNPFDIIAYLSVGKLGYAFHILMITCIILLTILITRIVLYLVDKKHNVSGWQYIVWCFGEVFIASCFIALYALLLRKDGSIYFEVLSTCMRFTLLSLIYPYVILALIQIVRDYQEKLTSKDETDESLMKFYDEHHRLKLSIAPSSILFIKSEANYIKIHYLDSTRVKEFLLRCSMKSIEAPAVSRGLVRCHRSFFVNPLHVKVLRKGTDGFIYAELNNDNVSPVPVSKQYYDSLSKLL